MASKASSLLQIILPKKKGKKGGQALTSTFNPNSQTGVVTVPIYRDHLTDIYNSRQADDSRTLMENLFQHDPDVSAAVNGYLTLANTEMVIIPKDPAGEISSDGLDLIKLLMLRLGYTTDYSQGFEFRQSIKSVNADLRYMLLLRGAITGELVLNDQLEPSLIRPVDAKTIQWREKKSGVYKPFQKPAGSNTEINLDIPTFFVSFFRRQPTTIYTKSFFVSAINTIAARQQVINDLYRIMTVTGFPRISLKVIEEVLVNSAPADVKQDAEKLKQYVNARINEIKAQFASLRSDQAFVHTDSVEASIVNDKNPGVTLQISEVIDTLNAQNQAALKAMATILGRGSSGVNTGSVEARLFSMYADELNVPLSEFWGKVLTFAANLAGWQGVVEVRFRKAELRPETELEPQLLMKAERLKRDLSDGLITDDEYHLQMYARPKPPSAPTLSGTGFMNSSNTKVDPTKASPNTDPLGRSITPTGSKQAQSNTVKKGN